MFLGSKALAVTKGTSLYVFIKTRKLLHSQNASPECAHVTQRFQHSASKYRWTSTKYQLYRNIPPFPFYQHLPTVTHQFIVSTHTIEKTPVLETSGHHLRAIHRHVRR